MYTERVIFIIFAPVFSNTNMLQPKSLALFLGLMMASATCLAQGTNIRTTHVVQQGETLYHIAKTYNVSVDDILSVNPTLSPDKYFVGMYINIPNSPALQAIQNDINGVEEHTTAVPNRVQAAVILPFMSETINAAERSKMVEYYRGFLMSVDSLKHQGVSIDIYTYDSGDKSNTSIDNILKDPMLASMNLIVGPMYSSQIAPLAKYAEEHKIRLIVPFTSKCMEVYNNPYVFMVNPPQLYLNNVIYEHFVENFGDSQIVFYETNEQSKKEVEFVAGLKNYLDQKHIKYFNINKNSDNSAIVSQTNICKKNVIIPNSSSINALNLLTAKLKDFCQENPSYKITLFGYPEWQTYHGTHLDNLYNFDTFIWSKFYNNVFETRTKEFMHNYYHWFNSELIPSYPKFGMLGFDTGYYFLTNLSKYGNEFEQNCSTLEFNPYQSGFKYIRMNSHGGYINTGVWFVHYSKDERRPIKIEY